MALLAIGKDTNLPRSIVLDSLVTHGLVVALSFKLVEDDSQFSVGRGRWAVHSTAPHRTAPHRRTVGLSARVPTDVCTRMPRCRSRFFRNQLKAWLIRHLVACNGDDRDLMAKAIAADGHDDDDHHQTGGCYAGKGAPGRESSMSGRVSENGRRRFPQELAIVVCMHLGGKDKAHLAAGDVFKRLWPRARVGDVSHVHS